MAKRPKVYNDRWEIVGDLGEGGQAHTFRVRDRRDGSEGWVLKRLKNHTRLDRFKREIQALEALDSPHIPGTEDFSLEEPAYHVSRYLGPGLNKQVQDEPLDLDRALALFEQVVTAVRDAHGADEAVVHRDIKPNNVVVAPDGGWAFLIDFGICQLEDGELTTLTTGEEPFGNAAFAAPECLLGREEEPGPPCDVYSLGKLLYWMVSGGRHINRETISEGVLGRIRTDNRLVRSYVARLLRGTVVEAPARRWTAQRLLEEVARTRRLVARLKEYEAGGLIVLADGFDLDDAYDGRGPQARKGEPAYPAWVHVIRVGGGDQPHEVEVGVTFEGPAGGDARLEGIDLALEHMAGEDEALIRIAPDRDGRPDEGGVLESLRVEGRGDFSTRVERLRSRARPVLREDVRYWILVSVPRDASEAALRLAPTDFAPQEVGSAERFDGREWGEVKSASSPGYAIRVTARGEPGAEG
ncbi:serine/threonine protein kinase [Rubrobacter marinus]|uniref:serine/threonine protein kinase n=1 Tax=Rubrobacter marinus TaxID=2653852 RepID=UPI00140A9978|nr:serine/threonine-protein kinase [Rubrobacter marinus]